jgi:hypothetical protein
MNASAYFCECVLVCSTDIGMNIAEKKDVDL